MMLLSKLILLILSQRYQLILVPFLFVVDLPSKQNRKYEIQIIKTLSFITT
jgi:hypothetical protein